MGVVKRGNSKYWYIQFQVLGQTYIKSSRTTNKRAAELMEADWRSRLHAQNYLGHRPSISLREALTQYCASKAGTSFHAGITSLAKAITSSMPPGKKLEDITTHDLERLKRQRMVVGNSPQTIKHVMNVVRGALKHAKKMGYAIAEVEFPSVESPKQPLRYLTIQEEGRLLAALEPNREGRGLPAWHLRSEETRRNMQDAYDLVVLLLDTGARYGEIANIEWRRIDLEHRAIHLWRPKVQNETILYMTDRVHSILVRRRRQQTGEHVFQNRRGQARGYASQAIRKAFRKVGLADCRIHTLRHTHASRLIQNGMSVYEVREILGHTDIKTTMRYAHLESRQVTSRARDVINRLTLAALPSPLESVPSP
jgi:integrase